RLEPIFGETPKNLRLYCCTKLLADLSRDATAHHESALCENAGHVRPKVVSVSIRADAHLALLALHLAERLCRFDGQIWLKPSSCPLTLLLSHAIALMSTTPEGKCSEKTHRALKW